MEQRRKISYPTILMFEKWIEETYAKVLPKSRLGEALAVTGNQEYIKIGNEATSKIATIVHQKR